MIELLFNLACLGTPRKMQLIPIKKGLALDVKFELSFGHILQMENQHFGNLFMIFILLLSTGKNCWESLQREFFIKSPNDLIIRQFFFKGSTTALTLVTIS